MLMKQTRTTAPTFQLTQIDHEIGYDHQANIRQRNDQVATITWTSRMLSLAATMAFFTLSANSSGLPGPPTVELPARQ